LHDLPITHQVEFNGRSELKHSASVAGKDSLQLGLRCNTQQANNTRVLLQIKLPKKLSCMVLAIRCIGRAQTAMYTSQTATIAAMA
jgi:hypothetical protein